MSNNSSQLDTGIIIRRSLFLLVLLILTLGNLFVLFRGLNSPQGMDQAQISREIARGNGFTTKMIRPVAYYQAQQAQNGAVPLTGFQDTYHSPLNPLLNAAVLKLIGADDADTWQMTTSELVFPLDRVIATVSVLFFLMAIGVNYLLVSRIFDAKIAGVCAILMLFCEMFWNYSMSGLPQMLMLLLFSCGIYFVYRAVEAASEGRLAMTPAIIAGVFFTLLALTHWMTVWIALGYIIYAAITFRPRGIVALSILVVILIPASLVMMRNQGISGSPFGTAFLTLYNGLGNGAEMAVMRTSDLQAEPLELDGLVSKILRTTLLQTTDIVPFLGGIVVAPLFFLSLLHPFKRLSIAGFRWAILLMWVFAALGMAFFGISKDPLDPNQMHLLFAPIMTAYGLAFISILWSRLEIVANTHMLRNVHFMVIIGICALPLILSLPQRVRFGMQYRDRGGIPNWPPYHANPLSNKEALKSLVSTKQVIFSDQPWATAWYADRVSIWLPPSRESFEKLETAAADLQTPVAGIVISPSSHGSGTLSDIAANYKDFTAMVLDGHVTLATLPLRPNPQFPRDGVSIYDKDQHIEGIAKRYPYRKSLVGLDMVIYSDRLSPNANSQQR
ncbi:MAG: glycosyltransferase family 39 protein [Verrucomicrobiota bacterium]